MYGYQPLTDTECLMYGAGNSLWKTTAHILDQLIIIAKAAYPILGDLGDRTPLLLPDTEEIQEAREEIKTVQQELIQVQRELKEIREERIQRKQKRHNISTPLLKAVDVNDDGVLLSTKSGSTWKKIRKFLNRMF